MALEPWPTTFLPTPCSMWLKLHSSSQSRTTVSLRNIEILMASPSIFLIPSQFHISEAKLQVISAKESGASLDSSLSRELSHQSQDRGSILGTAGWEYWDPDHSHPSSLIEWRFQRSKLRRPDATALPGVPLINHSKKRKTLFPLPVLEQCLREFPQGRDRL